MKKLIVGLFLINFSVLLNAAASLSVDVSTEDAVLAALTRDSIKAAALLVRDGAPVSPEAYEIAYIRHSEVCGKGSPRQRNLLAIVRAYEAQLTSKGVHVGGGMKRKKK